MAEDNNGKRESVNEILRRTALRFAEERTRQYIQQLEAIASASENLIDSAAAGDSICQVPTEKLDQVKQALSDWKKAA